MFDPLFWTLVSPLLVGGLCGALAAALLIWALEGFPIRRKKQAQTSAVTPVNEVPIHPKSVNVEQDPFLIAYAREKYGADKFCVRCGGHLEEHDIYGTMFHVPDLNKVRDGYWVSTADCPEFIGPDGIARKNPIWEERGLEGSPLQAISMLNQELARNTRKE